VIGVGGGRRRPHQAAQQPQARSTEGRKTILERITQFRHQ